MNAPAGRPFSRVYGEKSSLTNDSARFRVRIFAFVKGLDSTDWFAIARALEFNGGIALNHLAVPYWQLSEFFLQAPIGDVLDAVTYTNGSLAQLGRVTAKHNVWRDHVAKALSEEGLAYRIDEQCGVHYFVDEEFERGRVAAIAELQVPMLAAALSPLEDAFKHIEGRPQDAKAAIRSIFEAVEVLAKIIDPRITKLNKAVAKGYLKEAYLEGFTGDAVERAVVEDLFVSVGLWVDALHKYRHGQDTVGMPSEELAIYVLASGCAQLRWLAPRAAQRAGLRQ